MGILETILMIITATIIVPGSLYAWKVHAEYNKQLEKELEEKTMGYQGGTGGAGWYGVTTSRPPITPVDFKSNVQNSKNEPKFIGRCEYCGTKITKEMLRCPGCSAPV